MAEERTRPSNTPWLAMALGVLHALLASAAVTIERLGAWNDMNPTMLVWAAFRFVDYPLWMLVDAFAPPNTSTTAEFVFVAIVGTFAWAAIGLVLQALFSSKHTC